MAWRVKDWNAHFEKSDQRKTKSCRWVAVPNKHDGRGYARVSAHPRAPELFCAWNLILQVASKMPIRGELVKDTDLTSIDLAEMTRYPATIFDLAFGALSDPKIGWMEEFISEKGNSPGEEIVHPDKSDSHPDKHGSHPDYKHDKHDRQDNTDTSTTSSSGPIASQTQPKTNERKPASGPHADLIRTFVNAWKAKYGADYKLANARDGKHIKWILDAVQHVQSEAERIVEAYIADPDPWLCEHKHPLSYIVSRFNKYRAQSPLKSPAPTGPRTVKYAS